MNGLRLTGSLTAKRISVLAGLAIALQSGISAGVAAPASSSSSGAQQSTDAKDNITPVKTAQPDDTSAQGTQSNSPAKASAPLTHTLPVKTSSSPAHALNGATGTPQAHAITGATGTPQAHAITGATGTPQAHAITGATGSPQVLFTQGKAEFAKRKLDKAINIAKFDKAIDLLTKATKAFGPTPTPASCESHLYLGEAYCEKAKLLKTAHKAEAQTNFLSAKRELRTAVRVGRGNATSKQANIYLMANLPKSMTAPRTGDGTEMIAARLGLHGQERGAGGIAKAQVYEFYADWCEPCKQMKPLIAKMKQAYGDQLEFKAFNVDDENAQEIIDQYEVCPVPTIIYLTPDSRVVGYSVGNTGQKNVEKQVQKILPQTPPTTNKS